MKKTKRILSLFLALAMLSSFVTVASAEENTSETKENVASGVIVLTPEENENYFNSLSEEERAKINEKIRSAEEVTEEYDAQSLLSRAAATKISIPGTFTMYQQTQTYYCSPAVSKSIVQYLSGTSDSQSTIATALGTTTSGTDPTTIPAYLNSKQSTVHYIYTSSPSQTTLLNNLYYDVVTMQSPSSVGIVNSTGANWHYSTSGHNLAVNAIYDDKSKVQFADPLGGTQSGWAYYYEKTSSVASSVTICVIW
ncbi:hypothetical protein [Cohnella sp. GCM10012308]|uniref:hypothetical protein n=1 Tax=Cohnella sp. GCM10012308 TaxID=3317329 RepID=UPI00360C524F